VDAKVLGIEINDWLDIPGRVELARWAEKRGFDAAYVAEITDPDAFVTCALVARATSRLRIGTAITQIGPRTAPMLASGAAAVASCGPGRFTLGLGVSSEAIISGWHGLSYDEPLVRARETVLAVRKLLAGERSREEGSQVRSKGFKLAFPPASPPPVHLAALNKGMLRLAGQIADGVWLNFVPYHSVGAAVKQIEIGAAAAGRPMPEVLLSITCDVTDDRASSIEKMRDILTFYVSSPAYRAAFAWHGYEKEMDAAAAAFAVRDRAAVAAAISDELIDSITLIGSAGEVRERLQGYIDAGVTSPNVCALEASRLEDSLDAVLGLRR
jgi:probable F420-dependent oxidoreductase